MEGPTSVQTATGKDLLHKNKGTKAYIKKNSILLKEVLYMMSNKNGVIALSLNQALSWSWIKSVYTHGSI